MFVDTMCILFYTSGYQSGQNCPLGGDVEGQGAVGEKNNTKR